MEKSPVPLELIGKLCHIFKEDKVCDHIIYTDNFIKRGHLKEQSAV